MKEETFEAMKVFCDLVTSEMGIEPIKFGSSRYQWHMFAPVSNYRAWVLIKTMRAIQYLVGGHLNMVMVSLDRGIENAGNQIAIDESMVDADDGE
jgi:hypothetical protein